MRKIVLSMLLMLTIFGGTLAHAGDSTSLSSSQTLTKASKSGSAQGGAGILNPVTGKTWDGHEISVYSATGYFMGKVVKYNITYPKTLPDNIAVTVYAKKVNNVVYSAHRCHYSSFYYAPISSYSGWQIGLNTFTCGPYLYGYGSGQPTVLRTVTFSDPFHTNIGILQ